MTMQNLGNAADAAALVGPWLSCSTASASAKAASAPDSFEGGMLPCCLLNSSLALSYPRSLLLVTCCPPCSECHGTVRDQSALGRILLKKASISRTNLA